MCGNDNRESNRDKAKRPRDANNHPESGVYFFPIHTTMAPIHYAIQQTTRGQP